MTDTAPKKGDIMSNFKLTDRAKQILIMALTFADDEIVKQNKDALIQQIKNSKINSTDDLMIYYVYIKIALDKYCKRLKDRIRDGEILSENIDEERKDLNLCHNILNALKSNFSADFAW